DVWIANLNSPRQSVVTGTSVGIKAAIDRFSQQGIKARPIPVSCAFHSPLMRPACAKLKNFLDRIPFYEPLVPVYSNTTGAVHSDDGEEIKKMLVKHLVNGVQFVKQIDAMYEQGARIFVEVGPGRVLSSLVQQILADRPHIAAASNLADSSGFSRLQHLMAQLITHGVPVQPESFNSGRKLKKLDMGNLSLSSPYGHLPPTTWLVNGGGVRPLKDLHVTSGCGDITPYSFPHEHPQGLAGLDNGPLPPITENGAPLRCSAMPAQGKEQAMFGFQKMMRQFLDSQNNVMMHFLQSGVEKTPSAPLVTTKPCKKPPSSHGEKKYAAHVLPRFLLRSQKISRPHLTLPLAREKTILITDDGQGIATAVSTLLSRQGYGTALLSHS
ncbi:MAG: acyltransferase domain-containing protein, partial [Desulfobulbaceae bacterium]|nr:acyltransferase domain-containing protein [Desulfobulbaceae bacterium]